MKVLMVNGSPHEEGCTYTALEEVAKALEKAGVETEIMWLGVDAIAGCIGCGACAKTGKGCFRGDVVNEFIEKGKRGRRIYLWNTGSLCRCFRSTDFLYGSCFLCRRQVYDGQTGCRCCQLPPWRAASTFDQINKYFTINCMPIVSSQYWNQVHGNSAEEVVKDEEGMQIMRTLGNNMAWLLKCIEAGKKAGIQFPEKEAPIRTNYIR